MIRIKTKCRVRASVSPTSHNKIWISSGRFPLHIYSNYNNYLNVLVEEKFGMKIGGDDENGN